MTNYSAAKEAVNGLTRSLAREVGEFGVRVNAIRPVAVGSAMDIPEVRRTGEESARLGIPMLSNQYLPFHGVMPKLENVAAVAAWLCTRHTAAFSGREFYIAGGHLALVEEPELTRDHFNAQGWTFDALCQPELMTALAHNQPNPFVR